MLEKPPWALRVEMIAPRLGYPPRDKWGEGPWQHEPDLVEWRHPASGYPCLIVRGTMGALCGYVGLAPDHPLHGKEYGAEEPALDTLHVHGGLTFSDACHEGGHICHVAQPGEPDTVWWLGFDCNHSGDYDPAGKAILKGLMGGIESPLESIGYYTYRDLAYVRGEVESLAAQLKALEQVTLETPTEGING